MRFVLGAITAALVIAVAMSFRTLNGLAAGTALLVVMGALKLLESRSRRDDGIVIGVALFLLLAAALATQSLWRAAVLSTDACGAPAPRWRSIAHRERRARHRARHCACRRARWRCPCRWRRHASCSSRGSPASSGRLQRGDEATTGLSDEMSPGSIGKLAIDYDPAFRVRFEGDAAAAQPRCTGAVRCSTISTDSPGAEAAAMYHPGARLEMVGDADPVSRHARAQPTSAGCSRSTPSTRAPRARRLHRLTTGNCSAIEPITSTVSYDAVSLPADPQPGAARECGPASTKPRCRPIAIRALAHWRSKFARAPAATPSSRARRSTGSATTASSTRSNPAPPRIDSVDTTLFDTQARLLRPLRLRVRDA